jgi:hypothetical protein
MKREHLPAGFVSIKTNGPSASAKARRGDLRDGGRGRRRRQRLVPAAVCASGHARPVLPRTSTATPALAAPHDCSTHSLSAFTIEGARAHKQATPVALSAATAALLSVPQHGHVFALEHIASPPTSSPPPAIRVLRI